VYVREILGVAGLPFVVPTGGALSAGKPVAWTVLALLREGMAIGPASKFAGIVSRPKTRKAPTADE